MSTVALASTERDGQALDAIESHHAELAGSLTHLVDALHRAIRSGDTDVAAQARDALVAWTRRELVPHAHAEESTLYVAAQARDDSALLIRAMSREHVLLTELIDRIERGSDAIALAADAGALLTLFNTHVDKENAFILPALAADPHVALADLLDAMHSALPSNDVQDTPVQTSSGTGHSCGCSEHDSDEIPELDVRTIPHAIRHATIFGALNAVAPGTALVLVAHHDPLPLLAQVEQRAPGAFVIDYLERGPEEWRLLFARNAA